MYIKWTELTIPWYLCSSNHHLYIISIEKLWIKIFNFKIQINMANKVAEQVIMFASKHESLEEPTWWKERMDSWESSPESHTSLSITHNK